MIDVRLGSRLHAQANASKWGVDVDAFREALERSASKACVDQASAPVDVERYLSSLHLEDLALACGCAQGSDDAWQHFVTTFRPQLYRAADSMDRSGGARDLVDSLYGDLFGVPRGDGDRQSLFRYFHGRSSLATWLRAVLAQRTVDRARERRVLDALPDDDGPGALAAAHTEQPPERARFVTVMRDALLQVLAALAATDRLRLACYYAQQMTLAQVGRLLGEHEATVSRQLAKTRASIRAGVELHLRRTHGLADAEIEECFASLTLDAGPLDLSRMFEATGTVLSDTQVASAVPRKKSRADRSEEGREP